MKVRNLADLHAMQKSGAVKSVEGMKFIEPQRTEAPTPPVAQSQSLEPLVSAIRESMEKSAALSQENTRALYVLVMNLSKKPSLVESAARPLRWTFRVLRNEDGFVSEIIAEAKDE